MVDFFYKAVGRQWKQWCSDHKESKSPTDVVSSYCRVALFFIDLQRNEAFILDFMKTAESNCSFAFNLGGRLCVERGCLSDINKHVHGITLQLKVTEYVLDENDQLMPMNRLHGENTVS